MLNIVKDSLSFKYRYHCRFDGFELNVAFIKADNNDKTKFYGLKTMKQILEKIKECNDLNFKLNRNYVDYWNHYDVLQPNILIGMIHLNIIYY